MNRDFEWIIEKKIDIYVLANAVSEELHYSSLVNNIMYYCARHKKRWTAKEISAAKPLPRSWHKITCTFCVVFVALVVCSLLVCCFAWSPPCGRCCCAVSSSLRWRKHFSAYSCTHAIHLFLFSCFLSSVFNTCTYAQYLLIGNL